MARALHFREPKRSNSVEQDHFSRHVALLAEQGVIARLDGYSLKAKMVQLIQSHSGELDSEGENVSEFFLHMCDMLVTGELSRMEPNAFKVYLVVMAHRDMTTQGLLADKEALSALTGITDLSAMQAAFDQLRKDGFIDSANRLVSYAGKRDSKKSERARNELFDRFAL